MLYSERLEKKKPKPLRSDSEAGHNQNPYHNSEFIGPWGILSSRPILPIHIWTGYFFTRWGPMVLGDCCQAKFGGGTYYMPTLVKL